MAVTCLGRLSRENLLVGRVMKGHGYVNVLGTDNTHDPRNRMTSTMALLESSETTSLRLVMHRQLRR